MDIVADFDGEKGAAQYEPTPLFNMVRPLNTVIFLKSDVKSRPAGARFDRAAYGFEEQESWNSKML